MLIAQCWDDGVINDIRLTDLLRKYNAKATFNLNPGLMGERVVPRWLSPGEIIWSHRGYKPGKVALKDIAEIYQGFQLASHCWKHENAGSISDEAWIKAALDARHFLEDLSQKECRGFAYPCGAITEESKRLLRESGFAYGRGVRSVEDISKCDDVMAFSPSCHFHDWNFWDRYEKAKKNQLPMFYFWGHSYEMFEYDPLWQQLEDKIKVISEDPDNQWVDVVDIATIIDQANYKNNGI